MGPLHGAGESTSGKKTIDAREDGTFENGEEGAIAHS